jgi:hypothetical protein
MHIDMLYEYPLKSAAPCVRSQVDVLPRGFANDRRWMLIDADGRFVTGRKLPQLVRMHADCAADALTLTMPDRPVLRVRPNDGAARAAVSIWNDSVDARVGYAEADAWLREALGADLRLAHMDDRAHRPVDPKYARAGDEVSFADGFPILVLGTASMAALNERVGRALPITRFRPNIVIATDTAHIEDHWKRLDIGGIELELVKPCIRCVFTTVDPARGELDPSGEPLATLKTYRRGERGIAFGMNALARAPGTLHTGAPVRVLE